VVDSCVVSVQVAWYSSKVSVAGFYNIMFSLHLIEVVNVNGISVLLRVD